MLLHLSQDYQEETNGTNKESKTFLKANSALQEICQVNIHCTPLVWCIFLQSGQDTHHYSNNG